MHFNRRKVEEAMQRYLDLKKSSKLHWVIRKKLKLFVFSPTLPASVCYLVINFSSSRSGKRLWAQRAAQIPPKMQISTLARSSQPALCLSAHQPLYEFALRVTFHLIWNINTGLEDSGEAGVD